MEVLDTELVDRDRLQGLWVEISEKGSPLRTLYCVCPHPPTLVAEGFSIVTDHVGCLAHRACFFVFSYRKNVQHTEHRVWFLKTFLAWSFLFLFLCLLWAIPSELWWNIYLEFKFTLLLNSQGSDVCHFVLCPEGYTWNPTVPCGTGWSSEILLKYPHGERSCGAADGNVGKPHDWHSRESSDREQRVPFRAVLSERTSSVRATESAGHRSMGCANSSKDF